MRDTTINSLKMAFRRQVGRPATKSEFRKIKKAYTRGELVLNRVQKLKKLM